MIKFREFLTQKPKIRFNIKYQLDNNECTEHSFFYPRKDK